MSSIWKVSGLLPLQPRFLAWAVSASAAVYTFEKITNNGNVDVGSQLQMTVSDAGAGKIKFRFDNLGPIRVFDLDIYFDATVGLSRRSEVGADCRGCGFRSAHLPLQARCLVRTEPLQLSLSTAQLSADSDAPVQPMGIHPRRVAGASAESCQPRCRLLRVDPGAIDAGGTNGIRAGLHVQAIGTTGGSDSYVNTVANSVPASRCRMAHARRTRRPRPDVAAQGEGGLTAVLPPGTRLRTALPPAGRFRVLRSAARELGHAASPGINQRL